MNNIKVVFTIELMYIKYNNGIRHSIIKECDDFFISNSKIIPFASKKEVQIDKSTFPVKSNESNIISICNNKIDEEITNFFFNAIHQNYLLIRKK